MNYTAEYVVQMLVRVPDNPVEGGSDLETGLCNFKPKSSHDANEADLQTILSVSHSDNLNFPVLARQLVTQFNKEKGGASVVTHDWACSRVLRRITCR